MLEAPEAVDYWKPFSHQGEIFDVQREQAARSFGHISLATKVLSEDSSFSGSFTSDEIELADKGRMHDKQVSALASEIQQETIKPEIARTKSVLVQRIGGWHNAENSTHWDGMRTVISQYDIPEVFNLLSLASTTLHTEASEIEKSFENIYQAVRDDMRRSNDTFNLIKLDGISKEPIDDSTVLTKVQQTAALLATVGSYKFHKTGRAASLESALSFIEKCVELEPNFDPYRDGLLDNLYTKLINSVATIEIDLTSKPSLLYDRPEMSQHKQSLDQMLETLARIDARYLLRDSEATSQDVA